MSRRGQRMTRRGQRMSRGGRWMTDGESKTVILTKKAGFIKKDG